jgi:general secretion pathway protein G
MTNTRSRRERHGFTLVEMLMVVVIIGTLATIVMVKMTGHTENAKRQKTWVQISILKTSIVQFEMEVGRIPQNLKELIFQGDENWPGPFLDSETLPTDGWGNDFRMEKKGKLIRVTSPGVDGQFDTKDDLWK